MDHRGLSFFKALLTALGRNVVPISLPGSSRPCSRLVRTLLALTCIVSIAPAFAASREQLWNEVDDAVQHRLPKTAIAKLEPIVAGALRDKAYPEAVKAIARKISLEGDIEGGKAEEKITRFQAELNKVPAAMKPAMEAILAHWYWQYFQQNRWRFSQRTQTGAASGPDLQTWDLARILQEIDRHFAAALADEAKAKATPIQQYDALLEEGTAPDVYRPTLYDFLAHEALQFYQAGEHAFTVAEDAFEIPHGAPLFGSSAEFLKWRPETTDTDAPTLKAIRLLQALLAFHEHDRDRSAFYDLDLERLIFGYNVAVDEDKTASYKAALEAFIGATKSHEISTRACAALASLLYSEGDPAAAHTWAQRGLTAYPESIGAAKCYNLLQQIEAKAATLVTERVWNAPWPTLDVTYRNIGKIFFRAIPIDLEETLAHARWGGVSFSTEEMADLLRRRSPVEWQADLPATPDYKERTEHLPAPTSLKPGYYLIVAGHNADFSQTDNQLALAVVNVSDLALVVRTNHQFGRHDGFILKAQSGEPVKAAQVRFYERNRDGRFTRGDRSKTDDDGHFQFAANSQQVVVAAEYEGQTISTLEALYPSGTGWQDRDVARTVFFTDRSLYRPGQTISYKGVSISYDKAAGRYATVSGETVTVLFTDPNGKEIARATHRTNDYGSFSGVFTAPRDRLNGQMSIRLAEGNSMTSFRIEEYKRPKFQVELKPPAEAAKLGEALRVTGNAMAYTGAGVGGAKVRWRVNREVQLPYWCWWWQPPGTKAIAHGSAVTEPDGSFKFDFSAAPDLSVPAKIEPTFSFRIHVDVTDTTGETRSSERSVRVGYTALEATVLAEEWQTVDTPVTFSVATRSLDGGPQPSHGTVKIYVLKQPATVQRARLQAGPIWWGMRQLEPQVNPNDPNSWEQGDQVAQTLFDTDASGTAKLKIPLEAGVYRAMLETTDRFGKPVTARQTVQVVNPNDSRYPVKLAQHLAAPKWSIEPGENFSALWGTGYPTGRAFVELECNGKLLRSYWTSSDRTQELIEQPVTEEMRGGFTLRTTYVRENRAYTEQRLVDVPWSNKQLSIKWERFRSKLVPGQQETWTATITGPDAKRTAAEMVATLYDASLDQFQRHSWGGMASVFRHEFLQLHSDFQNKEAAFSVETSWNPIDQRDADWTYRAFPPGISEIRGEQAILLSPFMVDASRDSGYKARQSLAGARLKGDTVLGQGGSVMAAARESLEDTRAQGEVVDALAYRARRDESSPPSIDLSKIVARKNLSETAFFFPHLLAGDDGTVKLVFTLPEALTEWKFLGFAHDKNLRSGILTDQAVTAKDLMVQPNAPRFLREGDVVEFTVKVSNQSDAPQSGTVKLTFADTETLKPVDAELSNQTTEQAFDVPAKQSRSYAWRIAVPNGMGFITYKAVAATREISDGEEGFLPVLSKRVLVTESLPLPIRGKTTKTFEFKKLADSGASPSLRSESLTVEMVSQPAWYAVTALPYLMEYPHQCSEQVFNRLYANALARHIAKSDPKVQRVFERWRNTPALESPLQKNQDLKSVLLEETPWLRDANKESEARRNVGVLFDENRLNDEAKRAMETLTEQQLQNGLWPWFPGGTENEYISLYITTGFGRLRHLGVQIDTSLAAKSLNALDGGIASRYARIQKDKTPGNYVPTYDDALYLYGRSFFLDENPLAAQNRAAVDFYLQQARKYWTRLNSRQSQAHLALALQRFGDKETPRAILRSLKERSITNEELGMYWRDTDESWWWYAAPTETQALMIEAFSEITDDVQAVEDCKVWLLKQKQTQAWQTTKATADAIYSLLLRGTNLLASDALVKVSLGGTAIQPEAVEAGTGYYREKFVRREIKPEMGHITVVKTDNGVSWGDVHWQYLEDISKITAHTGTPLRLKKSLFIKETTAKGQILKPVTGPVSVGDELVVRIELRSDRDMEFVHLKDQRGSGTEPVNVLSRYRYQDGLAYYESTRDTASHFFIDYLRRGVYVFEYSVRVQLKGRYETGLAEIQCMYAPEFNSHSESIAVDVK